MTPDSFGQVRKQLHKKAKEVKGVSQELKAIRQLNLVSSSKLMLEERQSD